jgi:regulator of RNase E activity RraA
LNRKKSDSAIYFYLIVDLASKIFLYFFLVGSVFRYIRHQFQTQPYMKIQNFRFVLVFFAAMMLSQVSWGQQISKDYLLHLTREWKGERFEDGRPKVPDAILDRMKKVTLEEAWAVLRNKNYRYQYEGNWGERLNPDSVLVGRALTAIFMPGRLDIQKAIDEKGHNQDGRILSQNAWPVDMLQKRDVYVVDQFDARIDGPTIGDLIGNSIYAKTGNGVVYWGALRDVNGLKDIGGFTSYFRSYHPSHHLNSSSERGSLNTTLVGINQPTRIGEATCMPGDVVLGRDGGVIFIPPHLAEDVVKSSEVVRLRDMFGQLRLREQKYTPGQIDNRWSAEIEKDFSQWLKDHIDKLPVAPEQIQEILKDRTW